MTNDAFRIPDLRRVQTEAVLCVREELLNRPPFGKSLYDGLRCHAEISRGDVARLPFTLGVPGNHHAQLDPGFRPPGIEGLHFYLNFLAVDVNNQFLPTSTRSGQLGEPWQPAPVFRKSPALSSPTLGRILPQSGVMPESTDQGDPQFRKGSEQGFVVVGAVCDNHHRQRSPRLYEPDGLFAHLKSGPELLRRTRRLGTVELHPEGQRDRMSKELNDDRQDNPVVSPDETGSRPAHVVEKAPGAKDVVAPLRTKSIVHHKKDLPKFEGSKNGLEDEFEEKIQVELELGEEAVEVALVYTQPCATCQRAHGPLALVEEPGQSHADHVGPTPLREGDAEIHHHTEEVRSKIPPEQGLTSASGNSHYLEDRMSDFFALTPFLRKLWSCVLHQENRSEKPAKGQFLKLLKLLPPTPDMEIRPLGVTIVDDETPTRTHG